jgi:hypothetical protein
VISGVQNFVQNSSVGYSPALARRVADQMRASETQSLQRLAARVSARTGWKFPTIAGLQANEPGQVLDVRA